ncbi:serine protease [Deinococcus koreensis]|uniref:Serine protease n=2 Tax=Deinococcus koreensis TaxID=2054903 RepID=A0A2K3V1V9_9DEIO|nr:serine protease [Deinococcus koreensis]
MWRAPLCFSALLCGLLSTACDQLLTPNRLGEATLSLGHAQSQQVTQSFTGSWKVEEKPAWLTVAPASGSGNVRFTVTADRTGNTPLAADQATLSGKLALSWTSGTGAAARSGRAVWTVKADQFELRGRIVEPVTVLGQDLQPPQRPAVRADAPAHGVIVKYRAQAPTAAGLTAQTAHGPLAAQRGITRLQAAGVGVRRVQALSERSAALQVSDVAAALSVLRADPAVESAVPNAVLRTQAASERPIRPLARPVEPADQYAPLQWPLRLLGYGAVWRDMEAGAYTRPVTVAVIDSGVRFDHPDLAGRLWGPSEGALDVLPTFLNSAQATDNGDGDGPDRDPTDPRTPGRTLGSHGTHVTGIIAARWGDNGESCAGCSRSGVVGAVSSAAVKVLPIRAIDAQGETDVAQVVTALRYAAGLSVTLDGVTITSPHPAQVINLSLGGEIDAATAQPMCDAVLAASQAGALVVVAAGNGYGSAPYYPAACPAAVAVGSVTLSGASAPRRAVYSSAYPAVQLSAPGGTDPFQEPTTYNGMSWDPQGDGSPERFLDAVISTGWDYVQDRPNYEVESGTSQAAPQVSALAALLLSKGVTTDAPGTLARLVATATDLGAAGRDEAFGFGMINAAAALGAPAVSDTLGLRLQDARGRSFQPPLDAQGSFRAFLGDGSYRAVAGRDLNANGVFGEAGEPGIEKEAVLGPATPVGDLGDLTVQPR